ncbi:MAG: DUF805 domain-containing protein [Parvibaculaceae bacterium]|jgi:uncharacterized membrane protein YhaH (DUF805 family)
MNIMSIFTGFAGRINRAKWWIGTVILIIVATIVYFILAGIFGATPPTDPAQVSSFLRSIAIMQLIVLAIIAYPATAMWIKRLNDRDRPSWFAYIFWAPTVLSVLGGLLGLTMTTTDMGGISMPTQTGLGWVLALASLAVGIWALVEMGILKGTDGPNQHGPDPLAR